MTTRLDRSAINQALAKAIAFKDCGKDSDAEAWALITLLELKDILR